LGAALKGLLLCISKTPRCSFGVLLPETSNEPDGLLDEDVSTEKTLFIGLCGLLFEQVFIITSLPTSHIPYGL
jgi:hypothetical protein